MKWCQQYTKAFHDEAAFRPTNNTLFRNSSDYDRFRRYGRGEQSEDQYKERMSLKKEKGKFNASYRNLDYGILKIAPKMRNVLTNKVFNQPYKINVKPIDAASMNERRQYKAKLLEFTVNQDHIKQFEMLSKLGLERPVPPGEIPPNSPQQVDAYIDLHPKTAMAMETKDYLTWCLYSNKWEQQSKEVINDIVDTSVGGFKLWVDNHGMVRIRRCVPERVITNLCINPDFRDLIRVGEYYEMTVSELRRITGGSFGEDVYKEIANKVAGDGLKYKDNVASYWNANTYSYAYDHEKITVLDSAWFSDDYETFVEESNGSGNRRMFKKDFNYVPYLGDKTVNEGKGMTDTDFNTKFKGQKQIFRKMDKNVYQCSWIVGTEYSFNFGLMKHMPKSVSKLSQAELPYVFQSTDFISTIGTVEEVLDMIQLNWLQFQSHVASSKPDGIMIERKALGRLNKKKKLDWKELLAMYSEMGSIVFDGYDNNGQPLPWMPIKELKNGLSAAANDHFQMVLQLIDLLRTMLGINVLTEGETPPERLGKAVAQLSFTATDNALSHLNAAYSGLYERVCRIAMYMMQSSIDQIDENTFSEALGLESYRFFNLNKDIGLREMGIVIEEGPDDYMKERMAAVVDGAIAAGEIDPEDGIYILLEDNIYRALEMLKKKRMEREQRKNAAQEQVVRAQGEEQQKTAQIQAQGQQESEAALAQREQQRLIFDSQIRQRESQESFVREVILKKLDKDIELEIGEREFVQTMAIEVAKGKMKIQSDVLKAKAKPKPATK